MQINGWMILGIENGVIRTNPRDPACYLITLVREYAIDMDIPRNQIDHLSLEDRVKVILVEAMKVIQDAPTPTFMQKP